jgi:hypothetical protein
MWTLHVSTLKSRSTRRTTAARALHAMVKKQSLYVLLQELYFYKITKSTKNPARKTIDQLDKNSNG